MYEKNDIIILEKKGFFAISTIEDIAKVNIFEDGVDRNDC